VTGYVARLELTNQNDRLQLFRRHANCSHSNGNVVSNRKESLTLDLNVRRALAKEVMHKKYDIKVKDLTMAVTSEYPDYTVYQLLSDIGVSWVCGWVCLLLLSLTLSVSLLV
jgi:hypothetical protein